MDWLGSQISMVTWVSPFLRPWNSGRVAPGTTSVGESITILDYVLSDAVLNLCAGPVEVREDDGFFRAFRGLDHHLNNLGDLDLFRFDDSFRLDYDFGNFYLDFFGHYLGNRDFDLLGYNLGNWNFDLLGYYSSNLHLLRAAGYGGYHSHDGQQHCQRNESILCQQCNTLRPIRGP